MPHPGEGRGVSTAPGKGRGDCTRRGCGLVQRAQASAAGRRDRGRRAGGLDGGAPAEPIVRLAGPLKDPGRFELTTEGSWGELGAAVVLVDRASRSSHGRPLRILLPDELLPELHALGFITRFFRHIPPLISFQCLKDWFDGGCVLEVDGRRPVLRIMASCSSDRVVEFTASALNRGVHVTTAQQLTESMLSDIASRCIAPWASTAAWFTSALEHSVNCGSNIQSKLMLTILRANMQMGQRGCCWLNFPGRGTLGRRLRLLELSCCDATEPVLSDIHRVLLDDPYFAASVITRHEHNGLFSTLLSPPNAYLLAIQARVSRHSILLGTCKSSQGVEMVSVGKEPVAVELNFGIGHVCNDIQKVMATYKIAGEECMDRSTLRNPVIYDIPAVSSGIYLHSLSIKLEASDREHDCLRDCKGLTYTFIAALPSNMRNLLLEAWRRRGRSVVARPIALLHREERAFALEEIAVTPHKPEGGGKGPGKGRKRRWSHLRSLSEATGELIASNPGLAGNLLLHCMHACIFFAQPEGSESHRPVIHFRCELPEPFKDFLASAMLSPSRLHSKALVEELLPGLFNLQHDNRQPNSAKAARSAVAASIMAGKQMERSASTKSLQHISLSESAWADDIAFKVAKEWHPDFLAIVAKECLDTVYSHLLLRHQASCISRHIWMWLQGQCDGILARSRDGATALHIAVKFGTIRLIRRLIANQADVNALSSSGHSPLHVALMRKKTFSGFDPYYDRRTGVASLLLIHKANLDHHAEQLIRKDHLLHDALVQGLNGKGCGRIGRGVLCKQVDGRLLGLALPSAAGHRVDRFLRNPHLPQKEPFQFLVDCWGQLHFAPPLPLRMRHQMSATLAGADAQNLRNDEEIVVTGSATARDLARWHCLDDLPRFLCRGRLLAFEEKLAAAANLQEGAARPDLLVVDAGTAAVVEILPRHIGNALCDRLEKGGDLQEVRLPLGRPPHLSFHGRDRLEKLPVASVTACDLDEICMDERISAWTSDQRAGIQGTLHRLSRERRRNQEELLLLIIRLGRHMLGSCECITGLVQSFKSTLLVGPPGVGKTTILREYTRMLSEVFGRRVVVVDTSMEIGGVGAVPHRCIGESTDRLEVPSREQQFEVMMRAVQNLTPQAIVIDEIGTQQEVAAAASIAARGIQLVATAHADCLDAVIKSPCLQPLIGNVQTHTVGDVVAKLANAGMKTKRERQHDPVFQAMLEFRGPGNWVLHEDLKCSVDLALAEQPVGRHLSTHVAATPTGNSSTEASDSESDKDLTGEYSDSWDGGLIHLVHQQPGSASSQVLVSWGGQEELGFVHGDTIHVPAWWRQGAVQDKLITWENGCTWTKRASRVASSAARGSAVPQPPSAEVLTDSLHNLAVQQAVQAGVACLLRFDGGVDAPDGLHQGPGGGAATFSRIRSGSPAGRPRCVRPEFGSWWVYLENTTVDLSEIGGLIAGLAGLRELLFRGGGLPVPGMRLLLLQGDSKYVVDTMRRLHADTSRWDPLYTLQHRAAFTAAMLLLENVKREIPGVLVEFLWSPRKVNRRADKLSHHARQIRSSNVQLDSDVVDALHFKGEEQDLSTSLAATPALKPLPIGLLFPGQGSQYVKMMSNLKDMPAVTEMLTKAQTILGYDILKLCLEGPESKLEETKICQPAMFIAGLAGVEKLRQDREEAVTRCQIVAGLSLGEYTALCAAGVFSFEDGLKLLKVRGEAMQEASQSSKQAMLSVAGLDKAKLTELCEQAATREGPGAVCQIANELFPRGFSVAGTEPSILALKELSSKAGALQAKVLQTTGGFHSQLMMPAQERLGKALDEMLPSMKPPRITVYSSVTAAPIKPGTNPKEIVELLKRQLTSPVLWELSVRAMIREGISEFYEVGPKKQIKAMMKRIDSRVWGTTTNVEV